MYPLSETYLLCVVLRRGAGVLMERIRSMKHIWFTGLLIGMGVCSPMPAGAAPAWDQVLGPARGPLPAPQADVVWRDDLLKAMAEAKRQMRPVFVTLRCLP